MGGRRSKANKKCGKEKKRALNKKNVVSPHLPGGRKRLLKHLVNVQAQRDDVEKSKSGPGGEANAKKAIKGAEPGRKMRRSLLEGQGGDELREDLKKRGPAEKDPIREFRRISGGGRR